MGARIFRKYDLVLLVSGIVSRMGTDKMAVYSLLGTVGGIVGLPVYAYAIAAQNLCAAKKEHQEIKMRQKNI